MDTKDYVSIDGNSYDTLYSNIFAYTPYPKKTNGAGYKFKYEKSYYSLKEDGSKNSYVLLPVNNFGKKEKFLFLGSEIIGSFFLSVVFLLGTMANRFYAPQFSLFCLGFVIAYVLLYRLKQDTIFFYLSFAIYAFTLFVGYKIDGMTSIYGTLVIYSALYVMLSFTIPTLIEKLMFVKGKNSNFYVFDFANRSGMILYVYKDEKLKKRSSPNDVEEN